MKTCTMTDKDFVRAMEAQGYKIIGSSATWFQHIWNEALAVRRAAERKD